MKFLDQIDLSKYLVMYGNFSLSVFTNVSFSVKCDLVVILYFRSIGDQISQPYSPAAVGVRVKLNDKVFFFFDYSSIGSQ